MKKAFQLKQAEDDVQQIFTHDEKKFIRLNKYLADADFCSRRQGDRLIEEKRVTVNGQIADVGTKVYAGQEVAVDGKIVQPKQQHVYIMLNKPIGITCTTDPEIEGNVADFMAYNRRIFPIGRLDKDSSGLLLLTSDGDIVNKILRAENNNEKEYIVRVNQDITPQFMKDISAGVEITNMRTKTRQVTKKCRVQQLGIRTFRIILTQGLNRQIRRMCTELGYGVWELKRIRVMNIRLGELEQGQWRYLTQEELSVLHKNL